MSNEHWDLLSDITNSVASQYALPRGLPLLLAERLEEVIACGSKSELLELNQQITNLLDEYLSVAEVGVTREEWRSLDARSPTASAFASGQLSFAQSLISYAADHRADENLLDVMRDVRYRPYIEALTGSSLTGKELALACEECPETVSRKLKQLRFNGIVDFRREGTSFINFLTPLANSAYKNSKKIKKEIPDVSMVQERADVLNSQVSPKWLHVPGFSLKAA